MLAKLVKEIPQGQLSYEPKWDGFRSIIFRDGDEVEIGKPQRAADDPVLPRARGGRNGEPAQPVRHRRGDHHPQLRRAPA